MKLGRDSIFIQIGRLIQKINPKYYNWIEFVPNNKETEFYPMIFLLSSPRSGSTLTYQILTAGIKSSYLTNLWNLLYGIPFFGGLWSKDKKSDINFTSNKGWVEGIYGESEGL